MAPSEDGRLVRVALTPLLSDIVTLHSSSAAEHNVSLTLDCVEPLPAILGDPGQLVQLFVNLIKNALEAMRSGGTITIVGRLAPSGEGVVVQVIDNGSGFEPSLQQQLFQPFFTTKSYGTGLGLAICKEIADFHGAKLQLISRGIGHGTVATVELPVAPQSEKRVVDIGASHTAEA
jgi:two-component system sporulation sensor kinase A